jgi:hypothetical protein
MRPAEPSPLPSAPILQPRAQTASAQLLAHLVAAPAPKTAQRFPARLGACTFRMDRRLKLAQLQASDARRQGSRRLDDHARPRCRRAGRSPESTLRRAGAFLHAGQAAWREAEVAADKCLGSDYSGVSLPASCPLPKRKAISMSPQRRRQRISLRALPRASPATEGCTRLPLVSSMRLRRRGGTRSLTTCARRVEPDSRRAGGTPRTRATATRIRARFLVDQPPPLLQRWPAAAVVAGWQRRELPPLPTATARDVPGVGATKSWARLDSGDHLAGWFNSAAVDGWLPRSSLPAGPAGGPLSSSLCPPRCAPPLACPHIKQRRQTPVAPPKNGRGNQRASRHQKSTGAAVRLRNGQITAARALTPAAPRVEAAACPGRPSQPRRRPRSRRRWVAAAPMSPLWRLAADATRFLPYFWSRANAGAVSLPIEYPLWPPKGRTQPASFPLRQRRDRSPFPDTTATAWASRTAT